MMGLLCVADSKLGEFEEGQCPVTRTGDYSDVVVVDADGRIIPWQRVARLDRTEMERTMREIAGIRIAPSQRIQARGAETISGRAGISAWRYGWCGGALSDRAVRHLGRRRGSTYDPTGNSPGAGSRS